MKIILVAEQGGTEEDNNEWEDVSETKNLTHSFNKFIGEHSTSRTLTILKMFLHNSHKIITRSSPKIEKIP